MFVWLINWIVLLLLLINTLDAQWDTYQATWEGKPGTVVMNMDWQRYAPVAELPYLLVVETHVDTCNSFGYGDPSSLNQIDAQNEVVDSVLSLYTYIESVGTLSHDCRVSEYYYLNDTSGVRSLLDIVLVNSGSAISLIKDEEWIGYLDFLYPDAFLIQTMVNRKVIDQFVEAGDDTSLDREIKHFAGFSSEDSRKRYKSIVLSQGFTSIEEGYDNNEILPYRLLFRRQDDLQLLNISALTLKLTQEANKNYGSYDGWEAEIIPR